MLVEAASGAPLGALAELPDLLRECCSAAELEGPVCYLSLQPDALGHVRELLRARGAHFRVEVQRTFTVR